MLPDRSKLILRKAQNMEFGEIKIRVWNVEGGAHRVEGRFYSPTGQLLFTAYDPETEKPVDEVVQSWVAEMPAKYTAWLKAHGRTG